MVWKNVSNGAKSVCVWVWGSRFCLEAKVTAEQRALEAKNKLEQIRYEAQQQVIEAEAYYNATILKAQADSEALRLRRQQLDPQILQWIALEKWNGILPYFFGGEVVPFLQLPTNSTAPWGTLVHNTIKWDLAVILASHGQHSRPVSYFSTMSFRQNGFHSPFQFCTEMEGALNLTAEIIHKIIVQERLEYCQQQARKTLPKLVTKNVTNDRVGGYCLLKWNHS